MGFLDLFKNKEKARQNEKYNIGMKKTRTGVMSRLKDLLNGYDQITEDLFDELTDIFIMADIGVETTINFIDELKNDQRVKGLHSAIELQPIIVDKMFELYLKGEVVNSNLNIDKNGITVILFVGVNGVGKTTTIAKIASRLKKQGKKVLLAAGDTFRAGAIDQLDVWAKRVGVDIVANYEATDPASVIFDALQKAKKEKYDVVLCDTAGRFQTKVNLMKELEKIYHVISREIPDAPQEVLLVIDATTGQNALTQARAFKEAVKVNGVILAKLDSSAKGGMAFAIKRELGLPILYAGLGGKPDDLQRFDREAFVDGIMATPAPNRQ
jgi:fused signal recognition particle receptor